MQRFNEKNPPQFGFRLCVGKVFTLRKALTLWLTLWLTMWFNELTYHFSAQLRKLYYFTSIMKPVAIYHFKSFFDLLSMIKWRFQGVAVERWQKTWANELSVLQGMLSIRTFLTFSKVSESQFRNGWKFAKVSATKNAQFNLMLVGGLESSSRFSAEQKNKTSFFWLFFCLQFLLCLFVFFRKISKIDLFSQKNFFFGNFQQ